MWPNQIHRDLMGTLGELSVSLLRDGVVSLNMSSNLAKVSRQMEESAVSFDIESVY